MTGFFLLTNTNTNTINMKQFALPKRKENKGKVPGKKSQGNKTSTPLKKASIDHILHLHQTIGNQAVQRMIKSGALQLDISRPQPGDVYTREIHRLAQRVNRSSRNQNKQSTELAQRKEELNVMQRNINIKYGDEVIEP